MAMTIWPTRSVAESPSGATSCGRINTEHREIGIGIIPHELGAHAAAIRECHIGPGRTVRDVAVGEDESIGREHEPRSGALGLAWRRAATPVLHFDADDRGSDTLHDAAHGPRIRV